MNQQSLCSKFTAVILAGGNSNNFSFLTDNIPKPLIKISGRTILHHLLHNLMSSGFKELVVVTSNQSSAQVEEHVNYCTSTLNQELSVEASVCVYPVEDQGTTDVLNGLSSLINNHLIVVPCDLYGTFDFKEFANEHSRSERICTIALLDQTHESSGKGATTKAGNTAGKSSNSNATTTSMNVCLGGNDYEHWSYRYKVVTTLNEYDNRILGMVQQIALDNGDSYELYKWHFPKNQKCVLRKNLVDLHVYAFSKAIFGITSNECLFNSSIRMDLLPYLIMMQGTPFVPDSQSNESTWKISDLQENENKVYYFLAVGDQFKCCRINSVDTLYWANMQMCRRGIKKGKIKNAVLGKVNLNDTCEIKNSVIGDNVTIGNNVKITDCVVMDNCTILDDTVLTKTFVGDSVVVESGTNVFSPIDNNFLAEKCTGKIRMCGTSGNTAGEGLYSLIYVVFKLLM